MVEIKELLEKSFNEELENVCYTLYSCKCNGIDAFYDFNGIKIFSRDINNPSDISRMFQKVYGLGYDDYVIKKAKQMEPIWLEEGYKLISPDKYEEWKSFVSNEIQYIRFYHIGHPIEDTLKLLSKINDISDLEELKTILISIGGSNNVLVKSVISFSKYGEVLRDLFEEIRCSAKK